MRFENVVCLGRYRFPLSSAHCLYALYNAVQGSLKMIEKERSEAAALAPYAPVIFRGNFKGDIRATTLLKKSAPVKIRTSNLLIRSQMLYPVELRAPKSS